MTVLARPRRTIVAAVCAAAASFAVSSGARADGPCPIRLVPENVGAAWNDAVAAARARLAQIEGPSDCRAVEVVVHPSGGATLAFITTDGRGAARALEAPADLAPSLEALLVTLPAPPAPPPSGPMASAPRALPAPPPSPPASPSAADAPRPALRVHVAASAGSRLVGVPVAHVAPVFSVRPSFVAGPWELGLFADYAPVYRPISASVPSGFALSTLSTGITVGARTPCGRASLGLGGALGVQSVSVEADDVPEIATSRSIDVAQPQVAVRGKLVYPEGAPVRFSVDLVLDAALGRFRDKATRERDLPGLARFGLSLSLGAEASVL